MPSSTLDDLLEAYTQVGVRNRAILNEFEQIAQQFHQQGIAFIVLKGADVISRLYGVRGVRPLSDVDLLVHESDVPAIDHLLCSLGFRQQIDGNPSYACSERNLSLDLITTVWYLDDQELTALWNRAPTRRFGTTSISCLETADLLMYATTYAVSHRGELSAAYVQDVKLLIEKESPDWSEIIAKARHSHLKVALHHGLRHVRTMYPEFAIPDRVLCSLTPSSLYERMLAGIFRRLVTTEPLPEVGHLLLFLTQPGIEKVVWLKNRLYPSAIFLGYRYGSVGLRMPWRMRLLRLSHLTHAGVALSRRILHRLATPSSRAVS